MTKLRLTLLLVNAFFAAGIALLLWLPPPAVDFPAPGGAISKTSLEPPSLRSIPAPEPDRSLFRNTPGDTRNGEVQEALSAPQIRLAGVIVSDEARVVLIEQQGVPVRRLQEGDNIDGWIVAKIELRSVTFSGQGQVAVYPLDPGTETPGLEEEISGGANSQDETLLQDPS